jgi:PAS domain-containing protein
VVALDGQARWVPDLRSEPSFRRAAAALAGGFRGLAVVPVPGPQRPVAVLCFLVEAPDSDGGRWVRVLESLAAQLASVMARRRAEDRLRRYARILEAELESSPDAVLVVGDDGGVLAANRRLRELCGLSAEPAAPLAGAEGTPHLQDLVERIRPLYESVDLGQGLIVAHGRRLRRSHVPLVDEDELVRGRIWHFRDLGPALETGRRMPRQDAAARSA